MRCLIMNVFKQAIEFYGETNQKRMLQEECAELIQAISKDIRGEQHNVEEEIADVLILLEQALRIYDKDIVSGWYDYKIKLLKTKIKEGVK